MSLFSSIQVDPKVIPYIQKAQGVGVVKVNNIGKCSAIIDNHNLVLTPYEGNNKIIVPIGEINLIQYDKGNFINEPKLSVGAKGSQFVLAGVDNNDDELNAFYQSLLDLRQKEEKLLKNNKRTDGMPHPNNNITNPNKLINTKNDFPEVNNPDSQYEGDVPLQQVEFDPVSEIRRYYELKEDGIISEEEFEQKKKQLLDL
ncbi:MAG: hypothetical protein BZ137_03805 [Methanosphaera sp. rholeuAM130]|nr:MAG: hypothetical protein BZ137_03805 [Methanosphaera sp. rholeuAM130]